MSNRKSKSFRFFPIVLLSLLVALVGFILTLQLIPAHHAVLAQNQLSSVPTNTTSSIIPGSSFTFAFESDIPSLDPASISSNYYNALLVTSQIYETLVALQPDTNLPVPGLATSWSVSSDNLTWTFNLRPGVTFHDGTVLDADAVRYNIERWWDPAHPYHGSINTDYIGLLLHGFKGDPGCLITAVKTLSSDQVQITLSEPYSPLPSLLTFPMFEIASPTAIQSGSLGTNPVGTGPFIFVEWAAGDHVSLAGSSTYWGAGPYLESLTFQVIPSDADRYAALEANTVQAIEPVDLGYVGSAQLDEDLQVLWRPALNTGYLGINLGHVPFDNDLVRQAIAHAIDKQSLVDEDYNDIAEVGQVASQFIPPDLWGHDLDLVDYAYDPVQAANLLTQAGYSQGFTTTLWVRDVYRMYLPDYVSTANAIVDDLQAVGITATLSVLESSEFLDRINNGENDLFLLGWAVDYIHPENFIYYNFCTDLAQAFGPTDNVICDQVDASQEEYNQINLIDDYESISQRIHDRIPMVPFAHGRTPLLFRAEVTGFIPSGVGGGESFKDVYFKGGALSVTKLTPSQGPNDVPVSVDIYGTNFIAGLTGTLKRISQPSDQYPLGGLILLDSTHLRATVPMNINEGICDLVITNPDGSSATLFNAYTAFDPTVNQDLYASASDLWNDPFTLHAGDETAASLGLRVRRQGGTALPDHIIEVETDFYAGDIADTGNFIGTGMVAALEPDGQASTTSVSWTPPAAGLYTLYAVIDPDDTVFEINETNNVISRTVMVYPSQDTDNSPPLITSFSINDGAANTTNPLVYLDTTATDDDEVASLLFVEYEFIQSINDWVPVKIGDWLPYDQSSLNHGWMLHPTAGVHYLQTWAADRLGNISLIPGTQMINYLPTEAHIDQDEVRVYRLDMTAGQEFQVRLTSLSGDADLYVWKPDDTSAGYSNGLSAVEEVAVSAESAGIYQIEVYGHTSADYRLLITIDGSSTGILNEWMSIMSLLDKTPPTDPMIPSGDSPTQSIGLPSPPITRPQLLLPLIVR